MSRKWDETPKPVKCTQCKGFCPLDVCITRNCNVREPDNFRYCDEFVEKEETKK